MRHATPLLVLAGSLALSAAAAAQLGEPWVTYSNQPSMLGVTPLTLTDSDTQVFFATGDLDQDTWDDVVAVRKQQASQLGKRPSFLLMNVGGVLSNATAQYASASDVPGDLGFLTPCNTRKCVLGDVDGDGWLDVVTCADLSDGNPKAISHPRVYRNLGDDAFGNWQGLRHEDARIPQLLTTGLLAVAPRFTALALGDVTADGAPDLYFVDHDTTETNIVEPTAWDLNDRLLVNSGTGWFTDESASRLTAVQLDSKFGADTRIVDVNADGLLDIVKLTTTNPPRAVRTIYNVPATPGNFGGSGLQDITNPAAPYGMDLGDLNHDAFLDIAILDDGIDKFHLGTGYDGLNKMIWGAAKNFTFLNGGDDGFGFNVYIQDLDGDSWNDVVTADVDPDLLGCNRRLHVYHNTGTVPGDMNLVLKEEVELASGVNGPGWKGAVGLLAADIKGTSGVAFGDWDKDGDVDLLLGTCTGTKAYRNERGASQVCQTDLGFAGPGSMNVSVCGDALTEPGGTASLVLTGAAPNAPIFLPLSLSIGPVPLKGGQLVPFPVDILLSGPVTSAGGYFTLPVAGFGISPVHVYAQVLVKNGAVWEFSNALDVVFGT